MIDKYGRGNKRMSELEIEKRIMAVFKKERPDKIPWMPRIEHWYNVNKVLGTLPQEFKGSSLIDVYRRLNAAMRLYISVDNVYGFHAPPYGSDIVPFPLKTVSGMSPWLSIKDEESNIVVKKQRVENNIVTIYVTPIGKLRTIERLTEHGLSRYFTEYPLKNTEDFKVLEYMLERTQYTFDANAYKELENLLGGQGMIWCNAPRSPLQRLIIEYMGVERTFINLYKNKNKVEEIMDVIKQSNERFYDMIIDSPVKVVNLADNLDCRIVSPKLFKEYYIPYYQEICDRLHKAGKYAITHADGYVKALLPLFRDTGLDGVEAVTFKPAGDVGIEEVKEAFKEDLILVDGIPYWHFLPEVNIEEFDNITKKVVKVFDDKLILGISDEMPPRGEADRLARVPKIICEKNS
jgi:uroporphyrinogen-III decarboxylase